MNARQIHALRLDLGLSQSAFGKLIGVKYVAVSNWERGVKAPSELNLHKLKKLEAKHGTGN